MKTRMGGRRSCFLVLGPWGMPLGTALCEGLVGDVEIGIFGLTLGQAQSSPRRIGRQCLLCSVGACEHGSSIVHHPYV